jgi:hypothetical protein
MIDAYKRFYSAGGVVGSLFTGRFKQMLVRGLGRIITKGHLMTPETRRYVAALEAGNFEFYAPGEMRDYIVKV